MAQDERKKPDAPEYARAARRRDDDAISDWQDDPASARAGRASELDRPALGGDYGFEDATPAAIPGVDTGLPEVDSGSSLPHDLWDTPPPVMLDEPLRPVQAEEDRLEALLARHQVGAPLPRRDEAPGTDEVRIAPEDADAFSRLAGRDPFDDTPADAPERATDVHEAISASLGALREDPVAQSSDNVLSPLELDPLPLDRLPEEGRPSWLTDFQLFQLETQRLARLGNWKRLAAVTGHALLKAPYALRGTKTSMLLDLALLYRDRLQDKRRAEQTFALLSREDPASTEALAFLSQVYEERGDWESIYDLLVAAVQATWAPGDRLSWTRQAAHIATDRLDRIDLAIHAWEGLWKLGDAMEEAARALARYYRIAGRWAEMADFLRQQTERAEGATRLVLLRELAAVTLSGIQSPDAASQVLESIVALSPKDPIATLQLARVYAQRRDWDGLERLGALAGIEGSDRDLQQLVADSLWQAGRLDQAISAYDRILAVDPGYAEAVARKREYLTRTEKYGELLQLLVEGADGVEQDEARGELLEQAARLAEEKVGNPAEAISLWEARIAIDPLGAEPYQALERLYEQVGDLHGIARTLNAQLAVVGDRRERVELLRRLGDHCASRLGDDARAEECWKEILALDPADLAAREDLIELHRRRGNFEALNGALLRQISLTPDRLRAETLCRMAAENLDENFQDAQRSIEAWRRVLDYVPLDLQALQALAKHYESTGDRPHQSAVLEQQLRAVGEPALRIELGLRIAELWLAERAPRAAAAAYERVLRLAPDQEKAREALIGIYADAGQNARIFGLLDYVATYLDAPGRIALLRRALDFLPAEGHEERFFCLRRILWLGAGEDASTLEELRREAAAAGLWHELAAVLAQLASIEPEHARRLVHLRELADICERRLESPARAYVVLQSALFAPEEANALLAELGRLSSATKRQEDMLALLDRLTTAEFELPERKETLARRADICERELEDPLRAFAEHRRRLELDPTDWSPLADLQRLCEGHGRDQALWRLLDRTYGELWDRTPNADRRLELLRRREAVAREKLDDPAAAFEQLVRRYRHDTQNAELLERLLEEAETQGAWAWLLPMLEASALAQETSSSGPDELAAIASLYRGKADDLERAFVIESAVFLSDPEADGVVERLRQLADETGRHDQLAATLRLGAATSVRAEHQRALLGQIAAIYEDKVKTPERAIDVHRRLLEIDRGNLRSLEVMLDWHRSSSQWRDLRDRLDQWLSVAPEGAERVPKLMELAFISEQYLADPAAALDAYGQVLEREPKHRDAKRGLESLLKAISEPALRLRWLQMQLRGAEPNATIPLQLEIAEIQERDLKDVPSAIATLQRVVEEHSATSPAFEPLAKLLRASERYEELARLLQARAEKLEDELQKLATLDEALVICHEQLGDGVRSLREQLYRAVLRLRPNDRGVRVRLARMLRGEQRFEDLAELLEETPPGMKPVDRVLELYELARIRALNLDQPTRAEQVYRALVAQDPAQEGAILALASGARARGDHLAYLELRRQQAKLLEPKEAALVLCHLAEVCDETPGLAERMVPLYREARALDPENIPAMEALKGIGRRLRSLRPAAALLPLDGEKELDAAARAARLRALGDNAVAADPVGALDWYRRAVAIEPDEPQNWTSLTRVLEELPVLEAEAFRARRGFVQAIERGRPVSADELGDDARRSYELAGAARRAGRDEDYTQLVQRAFDLLPSFAPAALATAEAQLERGEAESAHHLLHEVLEQHRGELHRGQQVAALFGRGEALRRQGDTDGALRDFREALHIDPLHGRCLVSIGRLLAEAGRYGAAMEHQVRALIALEDPEARGQQYYRLGLLLEDALGRAEEAGACYEMALAEGLHERELLHRALRHYQRSGRLDESLDVVEGLLPTAEAPDELATLWMARGEILAARDGYEDESIEAFDMALSYDPGHPEARRGLVQVLERRGDWNQVLQVLEASCDVGTDEQRSEALRRMARICHEQLGDEERSEKYLRQAVTTYPTIEALEQLEQLYGTSEARTEERKDVLGLLVAFGPPWFSRVLELGKLLLVDNELWAWCLLSPLLGVSQIEPSTKALLQGMRKEYERPPLRSPYGNDELYSLLVHPHAQRDVAEVLAELLEIVPDLGLHALAQAGDGGAISIGANTSLGRKFFALAGPAGLPSCTLHRTQSLPESVVFVNEPEGPRVVVRTDVMQQLVHAEVGFLFGYALELAQPGPRTMAVLPPEQRSQLLPALWHALGFIDKPGRKAKALVQRIREVLDDERRERWTGMLEPLRRTDPAQLGATWWAAVRYMARRAGLLAGPDLRQAFRVVARIDEEIGRPRVVARLEELDEYVAGSDVVRDMVAFAASPVFGQLLRLADVLEAE